MGENDRLAVLKKTAKKAKELLTANTDLSEEQATDALRARLINDARDARENDDQVTSEDLRSVAAALSEES